MMTASGPFASERIRIGGNSTSAFEGALKAVLGIRPSMAKISSSNALPTQMM
jgi:hypothetical protein